MRAEDVECVQVERLLGCLRVARADVAQRLHGAADAAEEQPPHRGVGLHLVEDRERRAQRRLDAAAAEHLVRRAARRRRARAMVRRRAATTARRRRRSRATRARRRWRRRSTAPQRACHARGRCARARRRPRERAVLERAAAARAPPARATIRAHGAPTKARASTTWRTPVEDGRARSWSRDFCWERGGPAQSCARAALARSGVGCGRVRDARREACVFLASSISVRQGARRADCGRRGRS